jgi:hypothetical protein
MRGTQRCRTIKQLTCLQAHRNSDWRPWHTIKWQTYVQTPAAIANVQTKPAVHTTALHSVPRHLHPTSKLSWHILAKTLCFAPTGGQQRIRSACNKRAHNGCQTHAQRSKRMTLWPVNVSTLDVDTGCMPTRTAGAHNLLGTCTSCCTTACIVSTRLSSPQAWSGAAGSAI